MIYDKRITKLVESIVSRPSLVQQRATAEAAFREFGDWVRAATIEECAKISDGLCWPVFSAAIRDLAAKPGGMIYHERDEPLTEANWRDLPVTVGMLVDALLARSGYGFLAEELETRARRKAGQ